MLTTETDFRLEPYDKWRNDTTVNEYPVYNLFLDDSYVANWTGTYWVGVMEFSKTEADLRTYFAQPVANNLTWSNVTIKYTTNYTVRIFSSGCLFYDTVSDSWSPHGCRVSLERGQVLEGLYLS